MRVRLPAVRWVEGQEGSVGTPKKSMTALTFTYRDVVKAYYVATRIDPCRDRPVPFWIFEVGETSSLVPQERPRVSTDVTRAYDLLPIVQACRMCISPTRAFHCNKGVTLRERRQGLVHSRYSLLGFGLARRPPWFNHVPIQASYNTDSSDKRENDKEPLKSVIVTKEPWHLASTPSKRPRSPETQHFEFLPALRNPRSGLKTPNRNSRLWILKLGKRIALAL